MADTDVIIREVEAFYQAYIDGFNREDADAFLESFAYPHALLTGGRGMLVTATAADQKRFHQQTMTALHERGWGRSDIDRLQIWPFSDALAMLVADVTRYKKDASVLEKVRACYIARRDRGTWKILAFMEIRPPFSGPGAEEESRTAEADTIIREVEAFYRAFIDGFNREDTDMYLRSFGYPNAVLGGEQGMLLNAKESDQQRFYQQVMVSIQGRGWNRTGVDRLQVWPLADSIAMLMADISRYKKDGTVLEQGRYCYTVRKDAGAWKILTLTEVKPPFSGPGTAS
jgi:ketosteroid isomerase-like protein